MRRMIRLTVHECRFTFKYNISRMQSSGRTVRTRFSREVISDLVTKTEKTISSQATVRQPLKTLSKATIDLAREEDFEDIGDGQADSVFITHQEERTIRGILELARKGKIHENNAFDLPMRVIDPGHNQSLHLRFWKFASQLLGASINIYDKRVENAYSTTTSMFESLAFGKSNRAYASMQLLTEEQAQQLKQDLRYQFYRQCKKSNSEYGLEDLGQETLDLTSNLQLSAAQCQFCDPYCHLLVKGLESESIRSLFLNVCECRPDLEVGLVFRRQPEIQSKSKDQAPLDKELLEFLQSQLNKSNILMKSSSVFKKIQIFKKKNFDQFVGIQNTVNVVTDVSRGDKAGSFEELFEIDEHSHETEISMHSTDERIVNGPSFAMNNDQDGPSQSLRQPISWSMGMSELNTSYFHSHQSERNFEAMTPWELESVIGKIRRPIGKTSQRNIFSHPKQGEEPILFDEFTIEKRETSLALTKKQQQPRKKKKKPLYKPMTRSMHVYLEYHQRQVYTKKQMLMPTYFQIQNKLNSNLENVDFSHEDATPLNQGQRVGQNGFANVEPIPENQVGLDLSQPRQSQSNLPSSFRENHQKQGGRNIRQMKERIFQQLQTKRQIKLSEIDVGLSVQSKMIIFLHLTTEHNLQIESVADGSDIILSF